MQAMIQNMIDQLSPLPLLVVAAILLLCFSARAAASPDDRVLIAPYLWAPDLKGSVTFGGTRLPLDIGVGELAGGLKAGALGYGQFRRDDHFLYAEALGFSFKDSSFEPARNLDIKASLAFAEVGYGRVFDIDMPLPTDGTMSISPYAGLRYASLDAKASTPRDSLFKASMSSGNHWVDPSIGLLVELPLSGHLSSAVKLDASGFDLNHDRYWSAIGLFRWYFSADLSVGLGYRATKFDADPHGGNDLRLRLRGTGPELGLAYAW